MSWPAGRNRHGSSSYTAIGGGGDDPWGGPLVGEDDVGGFGGEAEEAGDFGGDLSELAEEVVELEASSFLLKARGSMLGALVLGTQCLIFGGDRVQSFLT